jgi:hypothetical protein
MLIIIAWASPRILPTPFPPSPSPTQIATRIVNQLVAALVVAQITLIGLLGIKEVVAPPLIVLPLPFLTLIFLRVAHTTFWPPMASLSLLAAAERDALEAEAAGTGEGGAGGALDAEVARRYVHPAFTIDDAAHEALVRQCHAVAAAQAAGSVAALAALADAVPGEAGAESEEEGAEDGALLAAPAAAPPAGTV